MATLFFARSGDDPNRSSSGIEVPTDLVVSNVHNKDKHFRSSPPVINPDRPASPYSAYEHVVIEIHRNEVSTTFPKAGYYWFPELSPASACLLFGIDLPAR